MPPRTIVEVVAWMEDLFARSKDIEDIRAILTAQAGRLDQGRIRAGAAQLLDAAGAAELEALLRDFHR